MTNSTLTVLSVACGAALSYGAMTMRVQYAEETAKKALLKAEGVPVLEEKVNNIEQTTNETRQDVKDILKELRMR